METIEQLLTQVASNPKHHLWPTIVQLMVDTLLNEYNFITPGWGTWEEIAIDWLVTGNANTERYNLGDHHVAAIQQCWAPFIPFQQYE